MGAHNTAKIRQRIIGIVIIVALEVIFLPNIWYRAGGMKLKRQPIPAPPRATQETSLAMILMPVTKNATPLQAAAWSLHLGSFVNPDNAQRLLKRLRTNHYSAYSQRVVTAQGILTKVYLGPETKRARLQTDAVKLR